MLKAPGNRTQLEPDLSGQELTERDVSLCIIEISTPEQSKQTIRASQPQEGKMNEEKTVHALTKDDFIQAVAKVGGPGAILEAFDGLRLANARFDREYTHILEQSPRHWIAVGPDGMIANVPVPEDSSEEDQEKALERLFELIDNSGRTRKGCLVRYIDPEEGMLIL